jgi:hypothetical protein
MYNILYAVYGIMQLRKEQLGWDATTCCAGVTTIEDFIKPRFADFSLKKTRGFFTYALAPFLTNITSHIERTLFTLIGTN